MIFESVEDLAMLAKEESLETALDEANTLKIRGERWNVGGTLIRYRNWNTASASKDR